MPGDLAEQGVPQPVDALKVAEEQDQLLEMRLGERSMGAVERVGDRMGESRLREKPLEFVHVLPERLDLAVLFLGDPPHQHMHRAPVLREKRGYLLADKHPREIRNLQAALNPVMVGESHPIHSAPFQLGVEIPRRGVTVGDSRLSQQPFRSAVTVQGMQVEIGFHGVSRLKTQRCAAGRSNSGS